jgi:excisionase family DNA binding protein
MELLTVPETARLLKVHPITVRRYIAQGRLPAVRVGKGVRVRKESVEALPEAIKPDKRTRAPRGTPITAYDPIWSIVGIGRSEGPTDVSQNKYKYLAEAYTPKTQ